MEIYHDPVMAEAVCTAFEPLPERATILDATLGAGGHTLAFLNRYGDAEVDGVDADRDMRSRAAERLSRSGCGDRFRPIAGWFDEVLAAPPRAYDRIVADLGVSMFHVRDGSRGFSFRLDGPLDMRLDRESMQSAYDLIRSVDERRLAEIIRSFGEERLAGRIARAIVEAPPDSIRTTGGLAAVIWRAVPAPVRKRPEHPAMRTFQALRIAVNDELGRLERFIPRAARALRPAGRLAIITFHSLEDRIVKHAFRLLAGDPLPASSPLADRVSMFEGIGRFVVRTKRPILPDPEEIASNPASRSAKLRVLERLRDH